LTVVTVAQVEIRRPGIRVTRRGDMIMMTIGVHLVVFGIVRVNEGYNEAMDNLELCRLDNGLPVDRQ